MEQDSAIASRGSRSIEWPVALLLVLLIGNLAMTRSFAHIGIAPLFIAELSIGLILLLRPSVFLGHWLRSLVKDGPLTVLAYSALIFVAYGAFQCLRGLAGDYPKIALQNFAFHFYVVFLFAGIWLGTQRADLLPKIVRWGSWIIGTYGVLYLLVFADASDPSTLPETNKVSLFGQPHGCGLMIVGLLVYERKWRSALVPLMLNSFAMLGNQVRAEWLAFAAAVLAFALLTAQVKRLAIVSFALAGLLFVGLVLDFRVKAPSGRGGDISVREIAGRAIASFDEKTATKLTPRAKSYSSTVSWRTGWWKNIYASVHESPFTSLLGHGYSFAIWELHPENIPRVRTPHNIAVFCLAYGGWIGVIIFYTFYVILGLTCLRSFLTTGDPFGCCFWVGYTVWAPFDNLMESPYGAIPFYLLCGIYLAPLLGAKSRQSASHSIPGAES